MKNPYTILGIRQDATKSEIKKATLLAMKEKKYSIKEIQTAASMLSQPSKRLAADFLFPGKLKSKRPKKISIKNEFKPMSLQDISADSLCSLKK